MNKSFGINRDTRAHAARHEYAFYISALGSSGLGFDNGMSNS